MSNIAEFKAKYKEIVPKLVEIRKSSGTTQEQMSEWIGFDVKKIIQFERMKKINLELLLLYGDKLSVDVKFNFEIN